MGASVFHHQTANGSMTSTTGYFGYDEDDSGTDTDTDSSTGEFEYNFDDIANLPEEQAEQQLFYAYSYHKGRYRRYMKNLCKSKTFLPQTIRPTYERKRERISKTSSNRTVYWYVCCSVDGA